MTTMTTKILKTAFHLARTSGNLELIYAELDSAVYDIIGAMRDYAEGYLYEISSDTIPTSMEDVMALVADKLDSLTADQAWAVEVLGADDLPAETLARASQVVRAHLEDAALIATSIPGGQSCRDRAAMALIDLHRECGWLHSDKFSQRVGTAEQECQPHLMRNALRILVNAAHSARTPATKAQTQAALERGIALTTRALAEVNGSGFGRGRHGVKRALSDARASLSVIQSRA